MSKVWFITGASRGMGVNFVEEALANGDKVIATARNLDSLKEKFGERDNLLNLPLDITNVESINNAVSKSIEKFNTIDVLINNAGIFYGGFFEELSSNQVRNQFETNVFGTFEVTRAVLPFMRKQKRGKIVTLSSLAGLSGAAFNSMYSASKFALEGWMESLSQEVNEFGIQTIIVEPGFFRTEFLTNESTTYGDIEINDYEQISQETKQFFKKQNGNQVGDPRKLAQALIKVVGMENPPLRFIAGSDSIEAAQQKVDLLEKDISSLKNLSSSLSFD